MPTTHPICSSVADSPVLVVGSWLGVVPRVMTSSTFAWVAAVALALYHGDPDVVEEWPIDEIRGPNPSDAETKGAASHRQ